ncbi:MAG: hypothetical protein ACR2FU_13785 [Streptosporangiaceae bacterium]
MTELPTALQDGPRELLSATRQVVRQVRQAQRGTWFPLLVFAVLTLASIPVTFSSHHPIACRVRPIGRAPNRRSGWPCWYWPGSATAGR